MTPFQIFKPGCHISAGGQRLCFSATDLVATAQGYDPALRPAPLVKGHPPNDQPVQGWVGGLDYRAGVLSATAASLVPAFVEAVRAGRYRHVSASFFPPGHPDNPMPGRYYLKHVGFLGAMPPAVKGLQPPAFCECRACQDLVQTGPVDFAAPRPVPQGPHVPAGYAMDAERWALHQRAIDYQEQHPTASYLEAVAAVERPHRLNVPAGYQVDAERWSLHQRAIDYQERHPAASYLEAVRAVERCG